MTVAVLRSPKTAPRVFGAESLDQLFTAVPRQKFEFVTEFKLSAGGLAMMNQADLNTWQGSSGIVFKVRTISKPKVNLQYDTLNQYNKKRIIYKSVEYETTNLKLYDTYDNSVLSLWVDYFTYYFGDSRPKTNQAIQQSSIEPTFVDDTGWGFRPLTNITNFFDYIKVYAFYANTYTSFKYMNPKIISIDFDDNDYQATNDFLEVSVSFAYESIQYEAFGEPFGLAQAYRWGWSTNDRINLALPRPTPVGTAQPRLFANQISQAVNATVTEPLLQNLAGVTSPLDGITAETVPVNQAGQVPPQTSAPAVVRQPEQPFGGQVPIFENPADAEQQMMSQTPQLTVPQQATAREATRIQMERNASLRIE